MGEGSAVVGNGGVFLKSYDDAGPRKVYYKLSDHGLSLMFRAHSDERVAAFDVLADLPVQSFLGSHSAWENLSLIPVDELPQLKSLRKVDQRALFEGLEEAATPIWRSKAWDMIWGRWCAYEDFCAQRQH